jgi:hypothetical protein
MAATMRPGPDRVLLSPAASSGSIWWAHPARLHLEEWSASGRQLRIITGDLPWFPEARQSHRHNRRDPPPALLAGFAVDGADRLWLLTVQPDPRWRDVQPQGPENAILLSQYDDYYDNRLDVFDLRSRRHVGTHVWNDGLVHLFRHGDDIAFSVLEFDAAMVPRIAVYRVPIR